MSKGVFVRMEDSLLKKLDKLSKKLGYSKSEVIREAVKGYETRVTRGEHTKKIRGLVKSKLTLDEIEELYSRSRV